MDQESNMDKGKKIVWQIDDDDKISSKRDRYKIEATTEPCEEEETLVKKARLDAPLSIPFYHASVDGPCNSCDSYCWGCHIDKGTGSISAELHDTGLFMDNMYSFTKSRGSDGVPLEAAEVLNSGFDEYTKQNIHPCMNLVQSDSYQIRMQGSEVPMQMNKQWLEQLGYMGSPTTVGIPNSVFTGTTRSTGIDLNQHPISIPYCQNPGSDDANGTGTGTQANMDIDLNLSLGVAPACPVHGIASSFNTMSSAGVSSGIGTSTSSTQGSTPSIIPLWTLNLSSAASSRNASNISMNMAHNLALLGSDAAAGMDMDGPENLTWIHRGAASSNPEWFGYGSGAVTGTGSMFFSRNHVQDYTESMANQMGWAGNVNGQQHSGINHVNTGSTFLITSSEPDNTEFVANQMGWAENVNGQQQYGISRSSTRTILFIESPEQDNTEFMDNQIVWDENVNGRQHTGVRRSSTGSIFFIGTPPDEDETESMADQMEWEEHVNELQQTVVGAADAFSGSNNLDGLGSVPFPYNSAGASGGSSTW